MATPIVSVVATRVQLKPLRYRIGYEEAGKPITCDRACELVGEARLEAEEQRVRGMAMHRLAGEHGALSVEVPLFEESPDVLERETVQGVIDRSEKRAAKGDVAAKAQADAAREHLAALQREPRRM